MTVEMIVDDVFESWEIFFDFCEGYLFFGSMEPYGASASEMPKFQVFGQLSNNFHKLDLQLFDGELPHAPLYNLHMHST